MIKHLKVRQARRIKIVEILFLCSFLFFSAFDLNAASIPNIDSDITIIAREQPISSFLQELFSQISVPVVVDESVKGTVNGSFDNITAREIINKISKSFGLVRYYDGAVVYFYTSNKISRRIIPASRSISKRIVRAAADLDLIDQKNSIRKAVDGGVVVTGTRRFIEQIDELVYAAESGLKDYEPPVGFKVFYLKYAWAQDVTMTFAGKQVVIPGVATILRQLMNDLPQPYYVEYQDRMLKPVIPGLKGQGLDSVGQTDHVGLPDIDRGLVSVRNDSSQPNISPQLIQSSNGSASRVRIQADPRLNAIIVRDSPDKMVRYQQLIESLDIEPQMLEIEATIIDINTDKLRELGINWRWQNNDDQVLFGSGDSELDMRLSPTGTITPSGKGGFISFVLGDNAKFISRINALEEQGMANVVSRPHVLTLSNVEAIFDTSSTFYVRIAGREEVDLYNVSVGTSLRVTPHVFKDDGVARIKLLVTIEDGSQSGDQQVDNIPVVSRSAINTQALIDAGESVLIGGMVREMSTDDVQKIPLLGDIPIIGNLFKDTVKKKAKMERMFLISPKLAVRKMTKDTSIDDFVDDLSGKKSNETVKDNEVKRINTSDSEQAEEVNDQQAMSNWQMILDI
ncbi:MAG: type III secretion system outer membrane ring subunit SctC [Candidatus Thiodiazotropha sp.]|jgi:type III secretion protein C